MSFVSVPKNSLLSFVFARRPSTSSRPSVPPSMPTMRRIVHTCFNVLSSISNSSRRVPDFCTSIAGTTRRPRAAPAPHRPPLLQRALGHQQFLAPRARLLHVNRGEDAPLGQLAVQVQ